MKATLKWHNKTYRCWIIEDDKDWFPEWTLPDSDKLPESDQIGTEPGAAVEGIPAVTLDSKGLQESTLHGGVKSPRWDLAKWALCFPTFWNSG
ncbi:hypothetical protein L1987_65755 [Smallanthus sonchifolius]|uniref:Uncharacterized protein n=1 Tax=Smallanthus sonchifolius TaxID=185202 RepID=A0ACB9BV83_9ASTR|nr:hypothetical protein L1987_65755 [Smallanthus sonchifolius]